MHTLQKSVFEVTLSPFCGSHFEYITSNPSLATVTGKINIISAGLSEMDNGTGGKVTEMYGSFLMD